MTNEEIEMWRASERNYMNTDKIIYKPLLKVTDNFEKQTGMYYNKWKQEQRNEKIDQILK
jgi:hypothetical protein